MQWINTESNHALAAAIGQVRHPPIEPDTPEITRTADRHRPPLAVIAQVSHVCIVCSLLFAVLPGGCPHVLRCSDSGAATARRHDSPSASAQDRTGSFKTRPVRRGRRVLVADDRRGGPAGTARAASAARELLSAADVTRTIARIAHQIIEKTADPQGEGLGHTVLIGIPTRGATLAHRLGAAIAEFSGIAVPGRLRRRHPLPRRPAPRARPARSAPPTCPTAAWTTRSSCWSTTC